MGKVYAVCEPLKNIGGVLSRSVDLSPALEFGELEILLPYAQSLMVTVPMIRVLKDKLREFSDDDYILPLGDPVMISAVAMVAGSSNEGRVKFLKWDKKTSKYYMIQVDSTGKAV